MRNLQTIASLALLSAFFAVAMPAAAEPRELRTAPDTSANSAVLMELLSDPDIAAFVTDAAGDNGVTTGQQDPVLVALIDAQRRNQAAPAMARSEEPTLFANAAARQN